MPYLSRGDTTFDSAVDRWFHYRTSRLDALTASLQAYQNSNDKGKLDDLLAKMRKWKTTDPNEYAKRGLKTGAYKKLLEEVRAAGQKYPGFNFGVEPPDPGVTADKSALGTVLNVSHELNGMKTWACLDAGNFAGIFKHLGLSEPQKQAILDREKDAKARGGGATVTGMGAGIVVNRNTWGQISSTAQGCISRKAAVCFSFAQSAAYIVGGKGKQCRESPRIEIVALKNHVFVLVGREGGFTESQGQVKGKATRIMKRTVLPPPKEWGQTTVVVDGWLASLGARHVIYQNWYAFGMRDEPGSQSLFSYYDNYSEA